MLNGEDLHVSHEYYKQPEVTVEANKYIMKGM